jgi:hypothetical protein
MPRRFTLGELVTKAQQRTDTENQSNIGEAEWRSMFSTSYGALYAIVAETGLRYFETSTTITSTGVASYDEPDGHWSTVSVAYVVNAQGERRQLYELMAQEQDRFSGVTGGESVAYALIDDLIYLYPTPAVGQQYEWRYVPQPPDLGDYGDNDSVDVVTPDGEAFLLWDVAVQVLAKEGSDTSLARAEREEARMRLREWAVLRALNAPRRRFVDDLELSSLDAANYWGRG